MLELEVMPEKGLTNGLLEITLGMPLVTCIEILKSNFATVKSVRLSYCDEAPLEQNIVLDLTEDGIKLIFDQMCQRLKIIEVYDCKRVKLKYCNNVFSAPGITPTLELIRQCFGPTRAGDQKQQMFLLSFRGILFIFPLWNTDSNSPIFDAEGFEFTEPSVEGSLVLSTLRIFCGSNPTEAITPSIPVECIGGQCFAESIEGRTDETNHIITSLKIKLLKLQDDILKVKSHDINYERIVSFGDSTQDIATVLGAPDDVYYKDDDKMRIHSPSHDKFPTSKATDYFYNYFTLGLDVLFDGACHRVKKFVLHTNYPGHYNFSSYHRCHFTLSFAKHEETNNDCSSQLVSVTTFTKWSEVVDDLTQGKQEKPVVLNRSTSTNNTNPFGYTYCYNHCNVIFEVMKNSHIASIVIYSC